MTCHLCAWLIAVMIGLAEVSAQSKAELRVVPAVDLKRYAGTWYEVARLPFYFQEKCVGDVTATYRLMENGNIRVINKCRKENGEFTEAVGEARRAEDDGPDTKLQVRFAPAFLSVLPFVWGDYWIIDLAPDYSYAAVGEPDRKYLWILSRTPSLDEATLQSILERVRQNGYDLSTLIRTQNGFK